MFGLSIWEIFLILVIALLVVGPERLPGLARTIGSWVLKVKKFIANAKAEMDSEFNLKDIHNLLNSQESEIAKLRALVEETRLEVTDSGRQVLGAVDDAEASFRASAQAEAHTEGAADLQNEPSGDGHPESASSTTAKAANSTPPATEPAPPLSFEEEIRALETSSGQAFKRPFEPLPEPVPESSTATNASSNDTTGSNSPKT